MLAPHGSICVELGDTYSGSGGAGGDYNEGGLRQGQNGFTGSAARNRHEQPRQWSRGPGWPLAKSMCLIPHLYTTSLAYGFNVLTGEPSPAGQWRIRNVICWARPNPPVSALGDKFRPATSYITVATRAERRYFDLDAVRVPASPNTNARTAKGVDQRPNDCKTSPDGRRDTLAIQHSHTTAPPLDWHADEHPEDGDWLWKLPTQPYKGSHYAAFPEALPKRLIEAMCPRRVCDVCGVPTSRVVERDEAAMLSTRRNVRADSGGRDAKNGRLSPQETSGVHVDQTINTTKGWTHCACGDGCRPTTWRTVVVDVLQVKHGSRWVAADTVDEIDPDAATRTKRKRRQVLDDIGHCADPSHWRTGVVLDPFAGSGTTLAVALGVGRHAIGIDLDERNANLARERCGMFLEVDSGEVGAA